MTIFGIYFLFSPIMATLKFIPLVGSLLSFAVAIAAFIVALVVGLVISCLVIAIAWVFYRPLVGISLLLLVGIGVYFLFFFPSGEAEIAEITDSSPTTDTVAADASASGPSEVTTDDNVGTAVTA